MRLFKRMQINDTGVLRAKEREVPVTKFDLVKYHVLKLMTLYDKRVVSPLHLLKSRLDVVVVNLVKLEDRLLDIKDGDKFSIF